MISRGNKRKPAITIEYFRYNVFALKNNDSFSVTESENNYFDTSKTNLLKPKEEVTFYNILNVYISTQDVSLSEVRSA